MNYIQKDIYLGQGEQQETLIALLESIGFEGFEQTAQMLKAFIPESLFHENEFAEVMVMFPGLQYKTVLVPQQNWNAQWESSFEPVTIGDLACIRANFHPAEKNVRYDIIVTPKMSFGTGHHATTYLMVQQMESLNIEEKSVLDFGTGTGVLAILAEKMGAASVDALDNDNWSIENAAENIYMNKCSRIHLFKAEAIPSGLYADIILANINFNVIKGNLGAVYNTCNKDGVVLFSGLLGSDKEKISVLIEDAGFKIAAFFEKDNWLAIKTQAKKS